MKLDVNWQVDLGNVLVAVVTIAVIFASLRQSRNQIYHAETLARREQDERANRELVREVADFVVDLRIATEVSNEQGQSARGSAIRRAEYLMLKLSPDNEAESKIRDLIHEATFVLSGDPRDRTEHFAVVSSLSAAVRKYARRNN